jgi:hypothetical protein
VKKKHMRAHIEELERVLKKKTWKLADSVDDIADWAGQVEKLKTDLEARDAELLELKGRLMGSRLADEQVADEMHRIRVELETYRSESIRLTEEREKLVDELNAAVDLAQQRAAEIEDMKKTWRPIPISHQWEPQDGRCALCDDPRDHERHAGLHGLMRTPVVPLLPNPDLQLKPGDPCPGCGKTVVWGTDDMWLSSGHVQTVHGRWACTTKGCTYGPPDDGLVTLPTDGPPLPSVEQSFPRAARDT